MPRDVSHNHKSILSRNSQWERIRDALEGQDQIKARADVYLPKPSGMASADYLAYLGRAEFFPVADRTLRGMSGLVFRNPVTFDLPSRLEPMISLATTDGLPLNVLCEVIVKELLSVGRFGLLLDYPQSLPSVTTPPLIATYTAECIVDWTVKIVDGVRRVTRLVLIEDFDEDEDTAEVRLELILNGDGNYEVRRWALKSVKDKSQFIMEGEPVIPLVSGQPLKSIPFVFVNAYDLKPDVPKPPMLDLVDVNIGHYRNSADYEHALYLTAQPTPWISGAIDERSKPQSIGSSTLWVLPEGVQVGMLEFQGAGIEAQRQAMLDKEARMAALGARMIYESKNRNESTDTARMRGRGELSLLTNVVNMAEIALKQVLRRAAEWVGQNPEDVSVRFNRDWIETRLGANEVLALVKSWQSGAISHRTLYENLQSGEIASTERSFEDELDLIEEEGGGLSDILPTNEVPA